MALRSAWLTACAVRLVRCGLCGAACAVRLGHAKYVKNGQIFLMRPPVPKKQTTLTPPPKKEEEVRGVSYSCEQEVEEDGTH